MFLKHKLVGRTFLRLFFLITLCLIPSFSHALKVRTPVATVTTIPNEEWYGPGYYFGNWYDDEGAYWAWRQKNRDYPSNRYYFSRYHRIYYRNYSRRHS